MLRLSDNKGALIERYEYTPYGQRTVYLRGWIAADITGDGLVGLGDFNLWSSRQGSPTDIADINGAGAVGLPDFNLIAASWGATLAPVDALATSPTYNSARITHSNVTSAVPLCEFGHQGLMHDEETGLVYNRARVLHPMMARFMQRDPLGYVDGLSLYEYEASCPTNGLDPIGYERSEGFAAGIGFPDGRPGRVRDVGQAQPYNPRPDSFFPDREIANARWELAKHRMHINQLTPEDKAIWRNVMEQLAMGMVGGVKDPCPKIPKIFVDPAKYPQAAANIKAHGKPVVGKIDRPGAPGRRAESLQDVPPVKGLHRDEVPPAILDTGGKGARVTPIDASDNTGAGASMGNQMRPRGAGNEEIDSRNGRPERKREKSIFLTLSPRPLYHVY